VSLGCPFLIVLLCCIVFLCFACLRPVSCVPDFASVSGLSILECFLCCIEWTTNRHWQNQAHKTQDKQNTKTQYNTENKKMGNTTNGGQARCRWFLLNNTIIHQCYFPNLTICRGCLPGVEIIQKYLNYNMTRVLLLTNRFVSYICKV
jgi:hypothetical protein